MKSVITNDLEHCMVCGSPAVVMHHAINGTAKRKLSDEDGLIIPLCPNHHNVDSKNSVHLNPTIEKWSKFVGQLAYEKELVSQGIAPDEARERFRERYGRSYL